MLLMLIRAIAQTLLDLSVIAHGCHRLILFYKRLLLTNLVLEPGQFL